MSNNRDKLFEVNLRGGRRELFRNMQELVLTVGDKVVVEAEKGLEFGTIQGVRTKIPCCASKKQEQIHVIKRLASPSDIDKEATNRSKEEVAGTMCRDEIQKLKLDMKLVEVEMQFDGSKMVFYFTADHRVDFRQLVKNLAGSFRCRIELRQIGVRDEAKRLGGVGVCGRPQCCSTFLVEMPQITTQLARDQQLSLNPTKISGNCGRLLCCLQYEEDAYLEAYKNLPRSGSKFTPDGKEKAGDVVFVDIFKNRIQVRTWEKGVNSFNWYTKDELDQGKIEEPELRYDNRH